MDRDSIYLEEIRQFCQKVTAFTAGVSYEEFLGDEKLQLAVIKLVERTSVKRLSD